MKKAYTECALEKLRNAVYAWDSALCRACYDAGGVADKLAAVRRAMAGLRCFGDRVVSLHLNYDVTTPGGGIFPQLHNLAKVGAVEVVEYLLGEGADPNAIDYTGATAIFDVEGPRSVECVALLLRHGARLDVTDEYGDTALMHHARRDNVGVADLLIAEGAPINHINKYMETALTITAEYDCPKTADVLMRWGARFCPRDAKVCLSAVLENLLVAHSARLARTARPLTTLCLATLARATPVKERGELVGALPHMLRPSLGRLFE